MSALVADAEVGRDVISCDVCVITTIHQDFDNRIYHRQVNALLDAGLSVCVVAPWDFSRRTRFDYDFVATAYPATRPARIAHGLRTYRAALGVDAKVYIFHDNDFLPWAVRLKRRTRRTVVYDAHENIPEDILYGKDWIPRLLRRPASAVFRRVEEAAVRRLGETIVAVPHLEKRFTRQGAHAVLVRNFSRFDVPAGFRNDRAVLYTGDLTRDYGVDNLINIAREMKRRVIAAPLRLVDRFREDDRMRQYMHNTIQAESLNVEILDSVPAERMPEILARGCIGLSPIPDLPNKRLALPTKIFEYYAFGLAALASDIEGTRDALDGGRLGFLLPDNDPAAWVDAIERLLGDPGLLARYQAEGRRAATELFVWANEERRLVDYVRGLIGRSR